MSNIHENETSSFFAQQKNIVFEEVFQIKTYIQVLFNIKPSQLSIYDHKCFL
jgi:hypothetical protein